MKYCLSGLRVLTPAEVFFFTSRTVAVLAPCRRER